MAIFPNIEQTVSGRDSSATTSHVITMPTGITAGDVLLVIFAGNYAPTIDITSNISWLSAAHCIFRTCLTAPVHWHLSQHCIPAACPASVQYNPP